MQDGHLVGGHFLEAVPGFDGVGGVETKFESADTIQQLQPITTGIGGDVVGIGHRVPQLCFTWIKPRCFTWS